MRITILGCGAAGGVPMIGPDWGVCDPQEPKNRRRRVSILLEDGATEHPTRLLVDTSPDLREQLIDAQVDRIDGVLYTHDHADHVHGIDDLRTLNRRQRQAIPAYGTARTLAVLQERFAYVLAPVPIVEGKPAFYKPCLDAHEISAGTPFVAAGAGGPVKVLPFDQDHGFMRTLGFRFGSAAYSTDVVHMPEPAFGALEGVKLWIVGCFSRDPHPTHGHLEKVLGWIDRVKPERAVLTHMSTALDYATLKRELPPHVEPGFDGMVLEVD